MTTPVYRDPQNLEEAMRELRPLRKIAERLRTENATLRTALKNHGEEAAKMALYTSPRIPAGDVERDAMRYRWLRAQHWNDNTISAVRFPKDAMKLGHDAPSGERLDALIDEAMSR